MNHIVKRAVLLVGVFALALLAVQAYRVLRGHPSIFQFKGVSHRFVPEKATFADGPAIDLSEVPSLAQVNDDMVRLVERVTPAVVSIDTKILTREPFKDQFGRLYERRQIRPGLGSGVIVTKEGHVVTNHHVIEGQRGIEVTLHGGRKLPATLISSDQLLDIAVLRIEGGKVGEEFPCLSFGDSDQVKVGQLAIAVGNPFGIGESVTVGRISARDRSLSDDQPDVFQTDAAINPGNSGGPLLNHVGEIIGINASIYTKDRENPGFDGIGFSIPSNDVERTLRHILQKGRPVYGYLGVNLREMNDYFRKVLGHAGGGVLVWDVASGSPAFEAGLQPQDVVLSMNGKMVTKPDIFLNWVQRSPIGEELVLKVWRSSEGKMVILRPRVGDSNAVVPSRLLSERAAEIEMIKKRVGIKVRNLTGRFAGQGVMVEHLVEGGLAEEAGLRRGDLILAVDRERVALDWDFYVRMDGAGERVRVSFSRRNRIFETEILMGD